MKLLTIVVLPLLLFGCAPAGPAGEAAPERTESAVLQLVLLGVPEGYRLADASSLRLEATGDSAGEIWVEQLTGEFNLVQVVNDAKAHYEGLPDGRFLGQLELGTQFGTAYTVRGRFTHEGEAVEERRIYALHPFGSGAIDMAYRYPEESDSQARGREMFGIFGQLEVLGGPVPE